MLDTPDAAAMPPAPRTTRPSGPAMRLIRDARDALLFFRTWLRDPGGVAAIAPSGRALAALITREIDANTGPVLELGSGTGAFTAALIGRGVAAADLTLIEQNEGFARLLAARYPEARVLAIDAAAVDAAEHDDGRPFGAAVCGLGLLNMRDDVVEAILRAAFARMAPGAALYLFTYGPRCSVKTEILATLGLAAVRTGTAYRNIPPASVYRLTRVAA
jgi:phosphatidylethanolamine/phosphatidyl-N-methylethanolamine N-methyltransferase